MATTGAAGPRIPGKFDRAEAAADALWARFGKELRLAVPLGLGKPNDLLNAIYARARADSSRRLVLFTALSLDPPRPRRSLERKFLDPFRDRHWGADYPTLAYAADATAGRLPPNVRVHEFYFQAGTALTSTDLQRAYHSLNYTHVAEEVFRAGVDAIVQLVARAPAAGAEGARYSLSCNPDVTLDLVDRFRAGGKPLTIVGVVHPDLPYVGGEAEVDAGFFDWVVEDPATRHALFALPRLPIDEVDHAIGFHASRLIVDGGTLQIGIGSLNDAIVAALILRQRENARYRELAQATETDFPVPKGLALAADPFVEGLYGLSELVTDGFMHLRRAGILKREVVDERSGRATYLHGAFYLGSREFYAWLAGLRGEDFSGLRMGRVSKVNDLYDPNELLLRRQRKHPRFLNTCMQVSLLGGAASDTLPDGRVVSGVGGQYNFVAMSHELPDSRSILMLRSAREEDGRRFSNIVASHGHLTIPRHLRDVVVTEYGIADIRGKSDEETVRALIEIADSEFQDDLVRAAIRGRKLDPRYRVPEAHRGNRPRKIADWARSARERTGAFRDFPFGSDFTPEEERLVHALARLKTAVARSRWAVPRLLARSLGTVPDPYSRELARMALDRPRGAIARIERRLILAALAERDSDNLTRH